MMVAVIRTRRAPSPQIGARDTALDGAANRSAGVHSAPEMDARANSAAHADSSVGIMRMAATAPMIESLQSIIKLPWGTRFP
jgi:hypothetical protein